MAHKKSSDRFQKLFNIKEGRLGRLYSDRSENKYASFVMEVNTSKVISSIDEGSINSRDLILIL